MICPVCSKEFELPEQVRQYADDPEYCSRTCVEVDYPPDEKRRGLLLGRAAGQAILAGRPGERGAAPG